MSEFRELDALVAFVVAIASDVLDDRTTPIEGARTLAQLYRDMAMAEFPGALQSLSLLESEWEVFPSERSQREKEIVIEMDRLRRRFGP